MNDNEISIHTNDPQRLAALRAVALLDTPTEESFDRLTWLASHFLKAPVSLVSLIDANRQFFKSCIGLPEPWRSRRETPLSHSFCQYNRIAGKPLLVADARTHPIFKENPAVRDLNVIAYLGIPLVTSDGYVLGSFCVIDTRPRHWTDLDVTAIEKLAFSVMTEINLRSEISARAQTEDKLNAQNEKLRYVYQELKQVSKERLLAVEQLRQRELMLIKQSRLAAMGEMIGNIAHQWRQPLNMLALLVQDLKAVSKSADFSVGYLDETVNKTMEIIKHMSKTIDDFRNFFRPDTEKVNFQIVETIKKTIFLLSTSLAEAHIKTEIAVEQSPMVNGYPNDYSQAIINIIFNARDACVERKVRNPKIYIKISSNEGRSVVTITDNAGGIPEDILDKIFDPYFSTKGPNGGTGIGLYMSKVLIEKHMGGSLGVKNTDDGAQFRILV